jgi:hypothetical protein
MCLPPRSWTGGRMRTELLAELRAIMRGECANGTPVTPATPVTPRSGNRPKALELQALQRLQVDASNVETANSLPVTVPVPSSPEPYEAEMEERAASPPIWSPSSISTLGRASTIRSRPAYQRPNGAGPSTRADNFSTVGDTSRTHSDGRPARFSTYLLASFGA